MTNNCSVSTRKHTGVDSGGVGNFEQVFTTGALKWRSEGIT